MSDLSKLREQIDAIDDEIVSLLSQRADLVINVRKTKKRDNIDIYSSSRERQIIDRVLKIAEKGNFPLRQLERIFINIIGASRSLIGDLRISYLGPEGSFGFDASEAQFGEAVAFCPEVSVENIVSKVEQGESHFGVVPIRNATTGFCFKTCEILRNSTLNIIAEVEIQEHLALCSVVSDIAKIQKIYGNADYVTRADSWLRGNVPGVSITLENNITRAAELIKSESGAALLLPEVTAQRLGLEIIARGIEDTNVSNAKYITLGHTIAPKTDSDKTSILCGVGDRPGVLRELLEPFSTRGLTLLKIESRPSRAGKPEYLFYLDVLGHIEQSEVRDAIEQLSGLSEFVKVLGSYPNVYPT